MLKYFLDYSLQDLPDFAYRLEGNHELFAVGALHTSAPGLRVSPNWRHNQAHNNQENLQRVNPSPRDLSPKARPQGVPEQEHFQEHVDQLRP